MRIYVLALSLGILILTACSEQRAPETAEESAAAQTQNPVMDPQPADQLIDTIVAEGGLPFLYVRLEDREGNVLYEHGAHNPEFLDDPVGGGDWIRIWSMSKIITIAVTMDLVEEGLISLDDEVTDFLPEFSNLQVATAPDGSALMALDDKAAGCPVTMEPMATSMTVRDLLNHTAGFYYPWTGLPCLDDLLQDAELTGAIDSDDLIRRLASLPLVLQPGSGEFYGTNTTVLGLLNERATGKSLQTLVAERVTGPLGIDGLRYGLPGGESLPPITSGVDGTLRLAQGGELDIFGRQMPNYTDGYPLYLGGEGMVATADGYADFARMLLNRGELNGNRLLETTTVEEIAAPHTQLNNPYGHNGYNLWVSNGLLADGGTGPAPLWIGGGYEGTHFWVDLDNEFVGVVMTQVFGAPAPAANFHERIRLALYQGMGIEVTPPAN